MSRRSRRLERRNILKKKHVMQLDEHADADKQTQASEHHGEQSEHHAHSERRSGGLAAFYDKNYKGLMIIPILLLLVSIGLLVGHTMQTGSIMRFGVSITGGISVTIPNIGDASGDSIEADLLAQFPDADITVRELTSGGSRTANIEASGVESSDLLAALEEDFGSRSGFSVEETGSTLGQSFFQQSLRALIIAFIIMGIVVFISFRTVVPSLAVILSAASDMIITMAIVNVLGIRVSTAGLAAFLMLIGYSVDTDILLTSRVLNGKGTIISRVFEAMNTGMTMTLTTIGAIFVAMVFSSSEVLGQIMLILLIGLVVDIINTWIQNAGIIRIYAERKHLETKE